MKVRKAIKSIVAFGTGAMMMGATMLGALGAADLANFPKPMYIGDDGAFDGIFVVGKAAAAEDVLGVADVKAAMQAAAVKRVAIAGGTETTTVEGDSFLVDASGDALNFLQSLYDVAPVADSGDLDALASGSLKNNKGTYNYDQYVEFPYAQVMYTDQSDLSDDPANYLKFNSSVTAWTYRLTFPTAAASDIDSNNDLDDFDNKKITMLGQEYTFVNTDFTQSGNLGGTMILQLMKGSITDTLAEGETTTYTVADKDYEVTVDYVSSTYARFTVDTETTDLLAEGDTFALADGTELGVKTILAQNLLGETGGDQVEFYFGATKVYLKDTDQNRLNNETAGSEVSRAVSASTIQVGSETISDAFVDLVWDNATAGEISLSQLEIGFVPSNEIYIGEGVKLTEEIADADRGDTDWVKLHDSMSLDFHYVDTVYGDTEEIKFAKSGSSKLKLTFTNKAGDTCSQNMFSVNGTSSGSWVALRDGATASKNITFTENWDVGDEGLFVIDKNKYSRILRLKKIDTTNTQIDLKDECLGTTQTFSYSGTTATFYKDGQAYGLSGISAGGITVSDITDEDGGVAVMWTEHGAKMVVESNTNGDAMMYYYGTNSTSATSIQIDIMEGADITRDDTGITADNVSVTVTESSSKITPSTVESTTEVGDSDSFLNSWGSKDDWSTGRTKWGTFVEHDTTGDQDTVTITYNEKEANARVYLTTGATSTTSDVTGSYSEQIVLIPVSTSKLDTQVSDVTADNMIVVGGPCVNTIAATLMGNPTDCTEGFVEGKAMIKLFENEDKVAMLVAGYSADDTRRATTVIATHADYADNLVGDEVEVTGTSLTDISVGTPAVEETTTTTVAEETTTTVTEETTTTTVAEE